MTSMTSPLFVGCGKVYVYLRPYQSARIENRSIEKELRRVDRAVMVEMCDGCEGYILVSAMY